MIQLKELEFEASFIVYTELMILGELIFLCSSF